MIGQLRGGPFHYMIIESPLRLVITIMNNIGDAYYYVHVSYDGDIPVYQYSGRDQ